MYDARMRELPANPEMIGNINNNKLQQIIALRRPVDSNKQNLELHQYKDVDKNKACSGLTASCFDQRL